MKQLTMEEWILEVKKSPWKRIPIGSVVSYDDGGTRISIVNPVIESSIMDEPDLVVEGMIKIRGKIYPAFIGFKEWISGFHEEFTEYEMLQWKERKEA